MQVMTFRLENAKPLSAVQIDDFYPNDDIVFFVPTLSAYAIHHTTVQFDDPYGVLKERGLEPEQQIVGDTVQIKRLGQSIFKGWSGTLTVYHVGIRDYRLLFPHIDNEDLKKRLGQFAEEAESAFNSQSWMSYVLMVGAVIEGLLYDRYSINNFSKLIRSASADQWLDEMETKLLNDVRAARNKVHASRYAEDYVERSIALDLSVVYQQLLRRDWRVTKETESAAVSQNFDNQ